ncbi:MAG: class I SAM-dependent methyltransferase [Desulfatiglans sp.]|nr:class I SAM-dependent methyltransferase [Desulfatiglans sp.]
MPTSSKGEDPSNGWESVAKEFISIASWDIGAATVMSWSSFLKPGQAVLDVGCGFGGSYTKGLTEKGIEVYGIDASDTLILEHQKRFPKAFVRCEPAEESSLFNREFDGVLSVGLIFLLSHEKQRMVLEKMADSVKEGGRLLFSSPFQVCDWTDLLTGKRSASLGRDIYVETLQKHGLRLIGEYTDEGENHYFDFQKAPTL